MYTYAYLLFNVQDLQTALFQDSISHAAELSNFKLESQEVTQVAHEKISNINEFTNQMGKITASLLSQENMKNL